MRDLRIAVVMSTALAAPPLLAAPPSETELHEMQAELASLRRQVQDLRSERDADYLSEQRAGEIRALVADVLADANSRASLLQSGVAAGYDKGFFITSSDGSFRLKINGKTQVRFVYSHQDDGPEDNDRWGFENRRFRLVFSGNVIDPTWRYKIGGGFNRSTGVLQTADVFLEKDLGNDWTVRAGKFKPPFLKEWLMSAFGQLTVDRSLVNAAFNPGRADGAQLAHQGENVAFSVMCSDGFGGGNTAALNEDTEVALTGRVEWLVNGSFGQFRDFTSWDDDEFGLLLGAAGHWERAEYGTVSGPEEETLAWTIDAMAEFGNANAFAALVSRHLDVAGRDQYGVVVQGGIFFVPEEWECFARYEFGDDDSAADDLSLVTLGVNRYFARQDLKWTADVGYAFNPVTGFWSSTGAGWREDAADKDGQIVIRVQMQLLF
ncbi:MAG: hypothetical protein JSV91_09695 [Phycisphaerales bacterium]|nr:MAG: hypothetical protein JSV91_09695 [Phycisphaerales bacterium]